MILSILVLMLPAVALYYFFASEPEEPTVATLDWKPLVVDARADASYPILAPRELGEGWKVTKARWTPKGDTIPGKGVATGNTWQFGTIGSDKIYYELTQRDDAIAALVADTTRTGYPDGSSSVNGRAFVRMTSADGRTRCLVDQTKAVGTVICADTHFAAVEEFAKKLA